MNFIKLLLLCILSTFLYANPILVDNSEKTIEILSQSEIYVDHSRKLTIKDVQNKDIKFEKNEKSLLGYGYSPNFDVWVKFTLKNTTDKTIQKILEYDNTLTTNIEFFYSNNEVIKEGSFNIYENRKTISPLFKIVLNPKEEKDFYIKTTSYITTLIIKLKLWNIEKFYEKEIIHQVILALFFGAMVVLAFYNLFVFFFTKDVSYLFYVLYMFGIILHQLIYVGFANLYIFNLEEYEKLFSFASIIVAIPAISLALFTKAFLQLNQYKHIDKALNILILITVFIALISAYTDTLNKYRNIMPFLLLVYLMSITIYASIKKNRQAYFILVGWVIFLSSGMFMLLSSIGILNINGIFEYYVEVSLVLEAIIFSIALADKIKQLQKEKNEMNQKLIIHEREEGERLRLQVEERTRDLEEALDEKDLLLKELSHRVKNSMQTIVSLIRLQADEIEDERVEEIFLTVQHRINAMSHLHELLYKQDTISHVNAFDYFDMMVDELKESYNTESVKIDLDINANLQIEQAIYCGLILNELITNAIKYAFEDNKGTIFVSLEKSDDLFKFTIKDDGIGYDTSAKTDSLGLVLVETLSKKQLNGEIFIDTSDGVKVDILWRENDKNKSLNS